MIHQLTARPGGSADLILVTANVKDFARFKGLTLEDWTAATASKK
jgi:predicted nucleic acid-binding protein